MAEGQYLWRYTHLPALIHMLAHGKVTLLDPAHWSDRNDIEYLVKHRTEAGLKSVLALCFTLEDETYQLWSSFAGHAGGVCVHFKRRPLLEALGAVPGVSVGEVQYQTLKEAEKQSPSCRMPFRKRYAFRSEREFRVVYESKTEVCSSLDVAIPLSCIQLIRLSHLMPASVADSVKQTLRAIDGCAKLKIKRSALFDNPRWMGAYRHLV